MSCIFIDIDGTLFDHEIGIQESSIHAIQQARKNGHLVCLATGRPKPEVDAEIKNIGFDGFIYSCGSLVEVNQQILFQRVMEKEDIKHIVSLLQAHDIGFNLEGLSTSYLDETGYAYFHNIFHDPSSMNSELTRLFMESIHMIPYDRIEEKAYEQIVKIAIFAKEEKSCYTVQNTLKDHLKLTLHGVDESPIINGEISYDDISKATGMNYILNHFQIPLTQTIAIGDSMNDADMIEYAQIGVAMANANHKLIDLCDYTTTSSKEHGIYQCFKKFKII